MKLLLHIIPILVINCAANQKQILSSDYIRPYSQNAHYWQYQEKPTLLLGGSKDDNLFQLPDLKTHLDSIAAVGANYIRNTMSSRRDKGWEVYRFKRTSNGRYDLEQWNDEYWRRFQNMLQLCYERDIIIQIEIWDRFDYSREHWLACPWRPENNINYSYEESGFESEYPKHPSRDEQPFFHSIPGMKEYVSKYDIFRSYQERYVEKLLSYSLNYPNVLYCMNNETSTSPAWGHYWMRFIQERAAEKGVSVFVTDMFDDFWRGEDSKNVNMVFDNPDLYTFIDISQVNSRNFDQDHWDRLRRLHNRLQAPRPLNNTKIYGGNNSSWGSGTNDDGVERFWRHLIGGSASVRHHRPVTGNGLNAKSQASIKAARNVETLVKFWDIEPHMELLTGREKDEAYLAAAPGDAYVLYFTDGGEIALNMDEAGGTYSLHWISLENGKFSAHEKIECTNGTVITAPDQGGWIAVLKK